MDKGGMGPSGQGQQGSFSYREEKFSRMDALQQQLLGRARVQAGPPDPNEMHHPMNGRFMHPAGMPMNPQGQPYMCQPGGPQGMMQGPRGQMIPNPHHPMYASRMSGPMPVCSEGTDMDRQKSQQEWNRLLQEHEKNRNKNGPIGPGPHYGPGPGPYGMPSGLMMVPGPGGPGGPVHPSMMMGGSVHPNGGSQVLPVPPGQVGVSPAHLQAQAVPTTSSSGTSRKRAPSSRSVGRIRMNRPPSNPAGAMGVPPENMPAGYYPGAPGVMMEPRMRARIPAGMIPAQQMHGGFMGPGGPHPQGGYIMCGPGPGPHMQMYTEMGGGGEAMVPGQLMGRMPPGANGPGAPNVQVMASGPPGMIQGADQDPNSVMMGGGGPGFMSEDFFPGGVDPMSGAGNYSQMAGNATESGGDFWNNPDFFPAGMQQQDMMGMGGGYPGVDSGNMQAGPQGDFGMMGPTGMPPNVAKHQQMGLQGQPGSLMRVPSQNQFMGPNMQLEQPERMMPGAQGPPHGMQQHNVPSSSAASSNMPNLSSCPSQQSQAPTVNNTYVNATFSIEQMNIQNLGPNASASHGTGTGNHASGGGNQQPPPQSMNMQQMNVQQTNMQTRLGPAGPGHVNASGQPQFVFQGVQNAMAGAAFHASNNAGPPGGGGAPNVQIRMTGNPNAAPGQHMFSGVQNPSSSAGNVPNFMVAEPITNLETKVPSGKLNYYPQDHQGSANGPSMSQAQTGMQMQMDHHQMMMQAQQRSVFVGQGGQMPGGDPSQQQHFMAAQQSMMAAASSEDFRPQGHDQGQMDPSGMGFGGPPGPEQYSNTSMSMQQFAMSQTVKTGTFSAGPGGMATPDPSDFDGTGARGLSSYATFQQQLYAQRKPSNNPSADPNS